MHWHYIEPLWRNEPAFILAGGPSLYGYHHSLLDGRHVIAVNNSYRLHPTAEYLVFCDLAWWTRHCNEVHTTFKGQPVTLAPLSDAFDTGVHHLHNAGKVGLSREPYAICHGNHSGYQAINLAFLLGADPIYLLGFDLRTWTYRDAADPASYSFANGMVVRRVHEVQSRIDQAPSLIDEPYSSHWHRGHGGTIAQQSAQLQVMVAPMQALAVELGKEAVRCYNCTPKSAIRCFEYRAIADVLRAPQIAIDTALVI